MDLNGGDINWEVEGGWLRRQAWPDAQRQLHLERPDFPDISCLYIAAVVTSERGTKAVVVMTGEHPTWADM